MKIKDYLIDTDQRHSDFIDAYAYMIAMQMAKIREDYILLYIKKKPKYMPNFLYKWLIKSFVVVAEFKK